MLEMFEQLTQRDEERDNTIAIISESPIISKAEQSEESDEKKDYLESAIVSFIEDEHLLSINSDYFTGLLASIIPRKYTIEKVDAKSYLVTDDKYIHMRQLINIVAQYKINAKQEYTLPLVIKHKCTNNHIISTLTFTNYMMEELLKIYPQTKITKMHNGAEYYMHFVIPEVL